MRTRRLALFAVLALVAMPSSALAQSAGDDQYSNPVPQTEAPSSNGSGGGSGSSGSGSSGSGSGSGAGAGAQAGAGTTAGTSSSGQTSPQSSTSDSSGSTSSESGSNDSGETLPRTGLPIGVLAALGLLLTVSGRRLRRASEERAPDPYAEREPDVPASSPVARARRRSD